MEKDNRVHAKIKNGEVAAGGYSELLFNALHRGEKVRKTQANNILQEYSYFVFPLLALSASVGCIKIKKIGNKNGPCRTHFNDSTGICSFHGHKLLTYSTDSCIISLCNAMQCKSGSGSLQCMQLQKAIKRFKSTARWAFKSISTTAVLL